MTGTPSVSPSVGWIQALCMPEARSSRRTPSDIRSPAPLQAAPPNPHSHPHPQRASRTSASPFAGGRFIARTTRVALQVGKTGRYWLHVGLRQQAVPLAGSPFLLEVRTGAAHARSSHLPKDQLPLVGKATRAGGVSCSLVVVLCDRMGNRCTTGGAVLHSVCFAANGKADNRDREGGARVHTNCVDLHDGSYRLEWQSQVAGLYTASVTIGNVHLLGSPAPLTLMVLSQVVPNHATPPR